MSMLLIIGIIVIIIIALFIKLAQISIKKTDHENNEKQKKTLVGLIEKQLGVDVCNHSELEDYIVKSSLRDIVEFNYFYVDEIVVQSEFIYSYGTGGAYCALGHMIADYVLVYSTSSNTFSFNDSNMASMLLRARELTKPKKYGE